MPTLKRNKKRDPFLTLPLKGQCELLGIPLEQLIFQRSQAGWKFGGKEFLKPEPAAYEHYAALGFLGTFCEGKAPMMLMKCASLNFLTQVNIFSDRADACLRYFQAQCILNQAHSSTIVDAIGSATSETIRKHFAEIRSKELYRTLYPEMSIDGLLSIWNALGAGGWARITEAFVKDPYTFSAGWPDLTIASGSELRLVEIKTTDKLHSNQKATISDFLLPFGLSVSVAKLVQPNPTI